MQHNSPENGHPRNKYTTIHTAVAGLFVLLLCACFLIVPTAESKRSAAAGSAVPVAAGTLTIKMTGAAVATPTDTFTLRTQVFTGSTTCGSGGGAINTVSGVDPTVGTTINFTSADSVLLTPFDQSDRNGSFQSWQNPNAATINFLPNNVICVAGFDSPTAKTVNAQYNPGIETLRFDTGTNSCTTEPKFFFNVGEKVCVRVSGTAGTGGTPWKVTASGGTPSSCNQFSFSNQNITAETQTYSFTLPASNAGIPGACAGTTDIRGQWQLTLFDNTNNVRGGKSFEVRDPNNPDAELGGSKMTTNGAFNTAGIITYQIQIDNQGPDAAPNATLVENVPAGTTFSSFMQTGGLAFNCTGTGPVTCTRSSFAPFSSAMFKFIVSYSGAANNSTITNSATINSSAADLQTTNNTFSTDAFINSSSQNCQVNCPPDITTASTSSSGKVVTYSNATAGGGTCTCTPSCAPASGTTFPIGTTTVTCQVCTFSNTCNFNVTVTDGQRPDLTIIKGHFNDFALGEVGATYTLFVKNTGGVATSGTVTVVESPPADMTITGMSGTGWTCNVPTLTCTRGDALAGGGTYPPITVTVNIANYVNGSNLTNTATVSGGNQTITSNDTATDNTKLRPLGALAIATATTAEVAGRILDNSGNAIAGAAVQLSGTQNRLTITDATGNYRFDNVDTTGFYTVTPTRANYTFSPAQRSFSQLGQHTDAAFTASLTGGSTVNPIDTTAFLVRQQYLDFLNREPEEAGFTSWVNGINNCASGDPSCDRIHVSEMFFRSAEFQDRGYYVYRFYTTAFGRKPDYAEFTPDIAKVSGFLTSDQLDGAKAQFASDFTRRAAFVAAYGALNNPDYVDALINSAQVHLSNRDTIVEALNNGAIDRAHALRLVADSGEVVSRYYNQAFVVMEYFGYLRRDPDALYSDWIDVLNQTGDARHMIEGFVNSTEYRKRFTN